jgi:hypothetical protein
MKRALVIAALMLPTVVFAGAARAQTTEEPQYLRLPHRFQIFLEGGGSLPTRPAIWNDRWNSGFAFGLGAGASIFPWLEVNAGFTTTSFSLNTLQAKGVIGYQGITPVEGGTVSMTQFYGSTRFIAVPKTRTNPFVEVAVGYYKSSGEDVVIEDPLEPVRNSMEDVSGLSTAGSVGIQHALADYWTAYAKYTYMVNFSDTFAPGDLLQPLSGTREEAEGNQVIQILGVGIMVRF